MARKSTRKSPSKMSRGLRDRASEVVERLRREYPDARCSLDHESPFQLIVATILSAQCTDARVNLVTPRLFARYPDAAALAAADLAAVESLIHATGFFRAKARNLVLMAQQLCDRHGGEVPPDADALASLAGVGRKTANVVVGVAFGIAAGVVVDTHVKRIAYRLGLTADSDPPKIEQALMTLLPPEHWIDFSHRVIQHGRSTCQARKPRCDGCALLDLCPRQGLGSSLAS